MSLTIEARPLTEAELRRAGEPRMRWARELNAGIGCVGVGMLTAAVVLLGLVALAVWLGHAWRWTFWGVTLGIVSLVPTVLGGLALVLGLYATLSYLRRRWRLARRGYRAVLPPGASGQTESLRFEASAAWIIDNNDGEPVGVWRVGDEQYLLAPTLDVEFADHPGGPVDDESHPAHWRIALRGHGVLLPGRELGWLELEGPRAPAPVIVPPEGAFGEADDEVCRLLGEWNVEHRALVKRAGELPPWLARVVAA